MNQAKYRYLSETLIIYILYVIYLIKFSYWHLIFKVLFCSSQDPVQFFLTHYTTQTTHHHNLVSFVPSANRRTNQKDRRSYLLFASWHFWHWHYFFILFMERGNLWNINWLNASVQLFFQLLCWFPAQHQPLALPLISANRLLGPKTQRNIIQAQPTIMERTLRNGSN